MGSDNDKTFGQLPKKRRKGRKDRSTLMIVGVCFGTVFLAGLFVAVLHVLNHPSHSSTKEGFKQLTDSAPVRPQASGTHRSAVLPTPTHMNTRAVDLYLMKPMRFLLRV